MTVKLFWRIFIVLIEKGKKMYKEYGITLWTTEDEGNHKEFYTWKTLEEAKKNFEKAKLMKDVTFVELVGVREDNTIDEIK